MNASSEYLKLSATRRLLVAALSSSLLVFPIGCGVSGTTASLSPSFPSELGQTGGSIHGGNQPVSGAVVSVYAAGSAGYGQGATLLAQTTTSSDGTGSFSFHQVSSQPASLSNSYACPSANSETYLIARGGNPGLSSATTNNSALAMMAALGPCGSVLNNAPFVNLNEVTTVASVFSLAQFMNGSAETIGSANTTQSITGLTNAFAAVPTLVTVATGTSNSTYSPTAGALTLSGVTVTATPESQKINYLANILATCVNTASSTSQACQTLFGAAVPPSSASVTSQPAATFATATDTLQAIYYIAINPTNTGGTYSCPDGVSTTNIQCLYNLGAAQPPFPSSLAQPLDWTIGIQYASTSTVNSTGFFSFPFDLQADAEGNVWVINGVATHANLSEVSPTGAPLACVLGTQAATMRGLTIDPTGNIWIGSNQGTSGLYRYNPNTAVVTEYKTSSAPYAVTSDGAGNIFYTSNPTSTLYEYPLGTASSGASTTPSTTIGTTGTEPYRLAADPAGSIWVMSANGTSIAEFAKTSTGFSTVATVGTSAQFYDPYGIAVDSQGTVWVTNGATTTAASPGNTFASIPISNTPTVGVPGTITNTAVSIAGLSTSRALAVDGADNLWSANVTAESSGLYSVSEISNGGTALSPSNGIQKAAFDTLRGLTIDPSGNVWVSNGGATDNSIVEIVGAAVPVVTPTSAALATHAQGTKP